MKSGQTSASTKDAPSASNKVLHKHPDLNPFDGHFGYRFVAGKIMYVEKSTQTDIAQAVHQCAWFQAKPTVPQWIDLYEDKYDSKMMYKL